MLDVKLVRSRLSARNLLKMQMTPIKKMTSRLTVWLDVARCHHNVRLVTPVRICYAVRLVHNLMIMSWTAAFSKLPDSRPHLPSYTWIMDDDNDDDSSHLPSHGPMKSVRNIISRLPGCQGWFYHLATVTNPETLTP